MSAWIVTLTALQHAARTAETVDLGGNVRGLSMTVDGVAILVSIDDGTDAGYAGSSCVFGLDYPDHPDRWMRVPAPDSTWTPVVIRAAVHWVRSQLWRGYVQVIPTDSIRDAAVDWSRDDYVIRQQCELCRQWLHVDTLTYPGRSVYRTDSDYLPTDGRTYCHPDDLPDGADERGSLRLHEPVPTYWRRVDTLASAL